jgi:ABC-type dipeptide/oligopeptide/nickel transport system permease subunit
VIGPGIAIFLSIVAFNLVADGLREMGEDTRR